MNSSENSIARNRGFSTSSEIKLFNKVDTTYPYTLEKEQDKPYIKTVIMRLCDLLKVYENVNYIRTFLKHKISEITTENKNIRLIFNYLENTVYLIVKGDINYLIVSDFNIVKEHYMLYTYKNQNKKIEEIEHELLDAFQFYDLQYIYMGSNVSNYKIYNYDFPRYFYNDEKEQEETIKEKQEQENDIFDIKIDKIQHINLRKKIINNDNLYTFLCCFFDINDSLYKGIKYNMWNYDISYKNDKRSNNIMTLLNMTRATLMNQFFRGISPVNEYLKDNINDIDDVLYNRGSYNRTNFIKNHFDIVYFMDEYKEEKIKGLIKYGIGKGFNFGFIKSYNSFTCVNDIIERLLVTLSYYLDVIKEEYDEGPNECVILELINFLYHAFLESSEILLLMINKYHPNFYLMSNCPKMELLIDIQSNLKLNFLRCNLKEIKEKTKKVKKLFFESLKN
jgi:hypothetical protein